MTSRNLRLTVGSQVELWNKVMKEVKAKRYAGPFTKIPFDNYIQSPIGLVPKDGGKQTRLIFHLSHPRTGKPQSSVNASTPDNLSKVSYPDFDEAVRRCLEEGEGCHLGKSDFKSAFRHLPILKKHWKFLVMKAQSPLDQKIYYFIDKCLPFGASISCAHFQDFSDAVAHIVQYYTSKRTVNYLDDYLFAALLKAMCDNQIHKFLEICQQIRFPVSEEKTFWGTTQLSFLGLLLDTVLQMVLIPPDKLHKAITLIENTIAVKKITLIHLQHLCGTLNFLCKCIVPGRTFLRRLYAAGAHLSNPNHHLPVSSEMKTDLKLWLAFLKTPTAYSRPFLDFEEVTSRDIDFYTDASRNSHLGCGGINGQDWFIMQWEEAFIEKFEPSIAYLELYAVIVGVVNWISKYKNQRITIFCDNQSVIQMINNCTSKCKNCMVLIRILVLQCLLNNTKISAKYVRSEHNTFADLLSRLKYKQFWRTARAQDRIFSKKPTEIPEDLEMRNLWLQ